MEPRKEIYVRLDLRNYTFLGLIRLLFSSDIENIEFIESSDRNIRYKFRQRWVIFVSVVLQKLLILVSKPLSFLGDSLCFWLNLLSSNGSLFKRLQALSNGWPQKESATFASVIGNLDQRVKLDQRVERGSERYKAMLSIMASKLSYENENFVRSVVHNQWEMDLLGFYNCWNAYQKRPSTKVIVIKDTSTNPNLIFVSFRGTSPFDAYDWCTDFDISCYEEKIGEKKIGKVHRGFMKALGRQKKRERWPKEVNSDETQIQKRLYAYYTIRSLLNEILVQNPTSKFIITGHSLGGALAILFTAVLMMHEEEQILERLEAVYTFGQPRVGDEEFGNFMKDKLKKFDVKYKRYVYCNDMVPRVPFDDKTLMFKHFGPCLYYNRFYNGKIMEEEPNKNYFNILWVIPKMINAIWELMRSFIISWKGEEFKEGWFLRCFRVFTLMIPGVTAHIPNEYLNVTLLGNLPLHLPNSHLD